MPEISQFTVPVTQNGQTTNVTYSFKDSTARSSSGAGKVSTTSDGVVSQLPGTTGGFLKNDGTPGGTWTSISIADLPGSSSKESIGVVRTSGELFMNGVYEPSVDGDGTEIDINDTTSGKAQLGRSNYRWSRIYGVTIEAANINVTNINGDELGSAAYADTENFLNSTNVDSSGSSGTSGWYNCRLYNGKIQYYNTNTTYSTTSSVTSGSSALLTSGGAYTALSAKANSSDLGTAASKSYTTSVTSGSSSLVTSGGVHTALQGTSATVTNKHSSTSITSSYVRIVGKIVFVNILFTTSASIATSTSVHLATLATACKPAITAIGNCIEFKDKYVYPAWVNDGGQIRINTSAHAIPVDAELRFTIAYPIE